MYFYFLNQYLPKDPRVRLVLYATALSGLFLLANCSYWKADNPVEEFIEGVIEKQTGLDVDLTPGSPECPKGCPCLCHRLPYIE